ncbi:hypothetical protein [Lewinella sp. IMCC34183]|nr:hypothetical protein [Lewinella sp. IMCC34183]
MARIAAGGYDIVHNHSLHHVPKLLGNERGRSFITSLHRTTPDRDVRQ